MKGSMIIIWDGLLPTQTHEQGEWSGVATTGELTEALGGAERFAHLDVRWPKPTDKCISAVMWQNLVSNLLEAIGGLAVPNTARRMYWAPPWKLDPEGLTTELSRLHGFLHEVGVNMYAFDAFAAIGEAGLISSVVEGHLDDVIKDVQTELADERQRRPSLFIRRVHRCDNALELVAFMRENRYQETLAYLHQKEEIIKELRAAMVPMLVGAVEKVHETCRRYRLKEKEIIPPGIRMANAEPSVIFAGMMFRHVGDNVFYAQRGGEVLKNLSGVGMLNRALPAGDVEVTFARQKDGSGTIKVLGTDSPRRDDMLKVFGINYKESSSG